MEFTMKLINLPLKVVFVAALAFAPVQGMSWTKVYDALCDTVQDFTIITSPGYSFYAQKELNKSFLAAVKNNDFETVKECLQDGADINATDENGHTAIFEAARYDLDNILTYLIAQGADINKTLTWGASALHAAVCNGHLDITKILIHHGIDVNAICDHLGRTALFEAVIVREIDILQTLINNGADINWRDRSGNTTLHIAACSGQFNIIKLLVNNGAKIDIENKRGIRAIGMAAPLRPDIRFYLDDCLDYFNTKTKIDPVGTHPALMPNYLKLATIAGSTHEIREMVKNNLVETTNNNPMSFNLLPYLLLSARLGKHNESELTAPLFGQLDTSNEILGAHRTMNKSIIVHTPNMLLPQTILTHKSLGKGAVQHALNKNTNFTDVTFL